MLGQHVEAAFAQRRRVLRVLGDGVDRDAALQHLERGWPAPAPRARLRRGGGWRGRSAASAAKGALGRADIDDEIDIVLRSGCRESACAALLDQLVKGHATIDVAAQDHFRTTVPTMLNVRR